MFQVLSDEIENLKTANIQQDLTINRLLEFIGQNNVLDIGELFNTKVTRYLFTGMSCGERDRQTDIQTQLKTLPSSLSWRQLNLIANSL